MRKIAFLPSPLPFLVGMWSWGVMTGAQQPPGPMRKKRRGEKLTQSPDSCYKV